MTPHDFAAAGRDVEVPRPYCPRPDCPRCLLAMSFWGCYTRPLRVAEEISLLVRRARCRHCGVSHALVPDFVVPARLYGVEVIGAGIEAMAVGGTTASAARRADAPARDWRRRFASRSRLLAAGFLAATVALGDLAPRLPAGAVEVALCAISAAARAARRRLGAAGTRWRIANRIVGGHLLSTNSDPPWISG